MERGLYLASTPLIALEAAGTAQVLGVRAQLVLLEDFESADRLAGLLRRWPDCPFEAIHCLPGRYRESLQNGGRGVAGFVRRLRFKRSWRAQTLATIADIDARFRPHTVWVGNDRKVEAQYALHLASARAGRPAGRYLDDGLHTYLGRYRERPLVRRIDRLAKRLAYGRWAQRVAQLGTTGWIAESWLAFPDQALDRDPCRLRRSLSPDWFKGRAFLRLSALAAREYRVDRNAMRAARLVLVLPHSRQIREHPELAETLSAFIAEQRRRGHVVALKYHPRETQDDPAQLLGAGAAWALPRLLPMELLLPMLPARAVLAGEASSALLAARWLRPDLRVFDLGISRGGYAERARQFLTQHGVPAASGDLRDLAAAPAQGLQALR